jgi:hypothetical protein
MEKSLSEDEDGENLSIRSLQETPLTWHLEKARL